MLRPLCTVATGREAVRPKKGERLSLSSLNIVNTNVKDDGNKGSLKGFLKSVI
jgi:hypothetical protein